MTSSFTAKVFKRRQGLPWQSLGGQTLVIEPQSQNSHELSGCGGLIWELMDGERTVQEIVDSLCEVFDGEPAEIATDTETFLNALSEKELIGLQS